MRQLAAIIYDSYLECRDRSALRILLMLSVCIIIFCFSISFKINSAGMATDMSLLFGLINTPSHSSSVVDLVTQIEKILADAFAGTIGMIVVVLVCAAFVPNMLQKGTLSLLLARPIGRGRLLMYKYVGSVCFILIMATFMIVGCWLGLSIRSGYWHAGFLSCILSVTALFIILHSVSVLFGVLTRSSTAAALITLGIWTISGVVGAAQESMKVLDAINDEKLSIYKTIIETMYVILPKTRDIGQLNTMFLPQLQNEYHGAIALIPPPINWTFSISTTVAFTAVMLLLAVWRFRRQEH